MSLKRALVQFNGGELSPWLEGRIDIAKYDKTAKMCRNFIPMAEGCLKRRGGSHFVALTVEEEELLFKIIPVPADAIVLINGVEQQSIKVARGDKVYFEVRAEGYSSQHGEIIITEETIMTVSLVSRFLRAVLEITPVPDDAEVKIEGIARRQYSAALNKEVRYVVSKNGYVPRSDVILMNEDKNITVSLEEEEPETGGAYGEWGVPLYFVACTAVGRLDKQLKCFCFRFSRGYLAIIFSAKKLVPSNTDLRLFFETDQDGFDSVVYKNKTYQLSSLHNDSKALHYYDGNGKLLLEVAKGLYMAVYGWQIDEDRNYASFYGHYCGSVLGLVGRVYHDGEMVWKLVGDF